eukprot:1938242-Pleurochrysis_carterae.AAC.4
MSALVFSLQQSRQPQQLQPSQQSRYSTREAERSEDKLLQALAGEGAEKSFLALLGASATPDSYTSSLGMPASTLTHGTGSDISSKASQLQKLLQLGRMTPLASDTQSTGGMLDGQGVLPDYLSQTGPNPLLSLMRKSVQNPVITLELLKDSRREVVLQDGTPLSTQLMAETVAANRRAMSESLQSLFNLALTFDGGRLWEAEPPSPSDESAVRGAFPLRCQPCMRALRRASLFEPSLYDPPLPQAKCTFSGLIAPACVRRPACMHMSHVTHEAHRSHRHALRSILFVQTRQCCATLFMVSPYFHT